MQRGEARFRPAQDRGGPWGTGEGTAVTCVSKGDGGWRLWHLSSLEVGYESHPQRRAGWGGFGGWGYEDTFEELQVGSPRPCWAGLRAESLGLLGGGVEGDLGVLLGAGAGLGSSETLQGGGAGTWHSRVVAEGLGLKAGEQDFLEGSGS